MAHNRLCIYIIHYVQFIILGENPGIWKLWMDYEHYKLPEPLVSDHCLHSKSEMNWTRKKNITQDSMPVI